MYSLIGIAGGLIAVAMSLLAWMNGTFTTLNLVLAILGAFGAGGNLGFWLLRDKA